MRHRRSLVILVLLVGAAGSAVALLVPELFADDLPDRLAVHWGSDGKPDGWADRQSFPLMMVGLWLFLCAVALVAGFKGWPQRGARGCVGALLGGSFGLVAGAGYSTISVNMGAQDVRPVELPGWHVALILGSAAALAALFGWLARRRPDETEDVTDDEPRLALRTGERTVWVGYCRNPWLGLATGIATVASLAALVAALVRGEAATGMLVTLTMVALVTGLASVALSSVRVLIDERGLRVRFGLLGWPHRFVPLQQITQARADRLNPSQVGGWGYRVVPGRTAVMLRGGDCLVIRRSGTNQEFIVSVDDAARGAALLNSLRDRVSV